MIWCYLQMVMTGITLTLMKVYGKRVDPKVGIDFLLVILYCQKGKINEKKILTNGLVDR